MTIGQLLHLARLKLTTQFQAQGEVRDEEQRQARSNARLEAEILLGHALEVNRTFFYANPETEVPHKRKSHFMRMLKARCKGMPVAYLTGKRAFWSLDLKVTPAVLIPRHETELLVEQALKLIPSGVPSRIADLGTGSGAIALSLARERPESEVHATDCSKAALRVAKENAEEYKLDRVQFHHGFWTGPLDGLFNIIISNPPYIAMNDPHLQQGDCRFEPGIALSSEQDGLSDLRHIAQHAGSCLHPGGWLLLEHGYDQGQAVRSMMNDAGYIEVRTVQDLAGIERVCVGKNPG